jgi:hypothetical protein
LSPSGRIVLLVVARNLGEEQVDTRCEMVADVFTKMQSKGGVEPKNGLSEGQDIGFAGMGAYSCPSPKFPWVGCLGWRAERHCHPEAKNQVSHSVIDVLSKRPDWVKSLGFQWKFGHKLPNL